MTTLERSHNTARPFSFLPLPEQRSTTKPRRRGLTMMIDQGLPPAFTADLVDCAGDYIDFAKIKTGTARFYPERVLRAKLEHYEAAAIKPFVGGQFHEYVIATTGGRASSCFYAEALHLGFKTNRNFGQHHSAQRPRSSSPHHAGGRSGVRSIW